jgi:hypothetical protein
MLTRRLLPWLFALTLLFGQAAAFAHTLTHLHEQDAGQHEPACEVCIAQASLGSTAPATGFSLPAEPGCHTSRSDGTRPAGGIFLNFAQARAPPGSI